MTTLNVSKFSPVFRFATIRSPKVTEPATDIFTLMPATELITDLIAINESDVFDDQKLTDTNELLTGYIAGEDFIKTKFVFFDKIDKDDPTQLQLDLLYDNIIVRILTKSNTNEVFKLLVDYARIFAADLNATTTDKVRIIIPERLTFSFLSSSKREEPEEEDRSKFIREVQTYQHLKSLLDEAREENIIKFLPEGTVIKQNVDYIQVNQALGSSEISIEAASSFVNERLGALHSKATTVRSFPQTNEKVSSDGLSLSRIADNNVSMTLNEIQYYAELKAIIQRADNDGVTDFMETESTVMPEYDDILSELGVTTEITIDQAEKKVNARLAALYKNIDQVIPYQTYAMIAGAWQDVTAIVTREIVMRDITPMGIAEPQEKKGGIYEYSNGCHLKHPVQVADLRVVEQQSVGYVPAEIAHINNTQRGEKQVKVTRRLTRLETAETIINETEVFRETDTQSTEKFGMESDAYEVQQQESNWNVNASVSSQIGPVSAAVNGGYGNSDMVTSGNSSAQTYAKEIFNRIVDRVSNRTKIERSFKSLEEFEETVTHEIDNSTEETKSYVYRWLNKLVRGTLKNYGKRLLIQVDIPHPANYYLMQAIKDQPQLTLPPDPRQMKVAGNKIFSPDAIDRNSYLALGSMYNIKLETPPETKLIISDVFTGKDVSFTSKLIPIRKGFQCKKAVITDTYVNGWPTGNAILIIVGNAAVSHYDGADDFWIPRTMNLKNETDNLAVSIYQQKSGFIMNIEIECEPTPEAYRDWQLKCYFDIIEGYDKLKSEAEVRVNGFDLNAMGMNPTKKMELIRTELKKEAIRRMNNCNPFWMNDRYVVGEEYNPNCCRDTAHGETIRFLENVFDWQNMTYEFHPYFYSNKESWGKSLNLSDDDPHFESFLQSSFSTVVIPVFREHMKEIAACNFLINNSIANYETLPEAMQSLIDELESEAVTNFTFDINGEEIAVPTSTIDLGVFPIPTSLVILECGNENGVKPRGYPEIEADVTNVAIPKQYSPAIIADHCDSLQPEE